MRTLNGVAAVLVFACGTLGADEKNPKIEGQLLLGKWEPKALKPGELTVIEFTKDGKLIATGAVGKAEGTYKLDGNMLTFTMVYRGETTKGVVTVIKLTDDEMESKDKEGKIDSYKRAKAK